MNQTRCFRLLAAALVLLVGYAWLVEPNRLVIRRVVIRDSVLARAWPGLTLVHLSDTHIVRMGAREARLLAAIKALTPDLIVMSGDFKQWQADPGPAQQFLAQLSAPLGVYGVLGDADQVVNSSKGCAFCHPGGRYHERLTRPVILQNELRRITCNRSPEALNVQISQDCNRLTGTPDARKRPAKCASAHEQAADKADGVPGERLRIIDIAGVGWEEEGGDTWLRQLQSKVSQGREPLLILSHLSERWRETPLAVHSLWLCGDTHGGQILLPDWLWRLIPYKPDPEHMGGVYDNGQGGWLIVNRGLGVTARFPFRLGVPPELLVITFAESAGGMSR